MNIQTVYMGQGELPQFSCYILMIVIEGARLDLVHLCRPTAAACNE